MDNFKVTWIFRNQHEWNSTFATADERTAHINRVGLISHPDIDRVYTTDPDGVEKDLKCVA